MFVPGYLFFRVKEVEHESDGPRSSQVAEVTRPGRDQQWATSITCVVSMSLRKLRLHTMRNATSTCWTSRNSWAAPEEKSVPTIPVVPTVVGVPNSAPAVEGLSPSDVKPPASGTRKARVLYDYQAADSSELSLLADEVGLTFKGTESVPKAVSADAGEV
uniref:Uncharacterized protein n=1 Tax=Sphaerodactylus townsendi TaxID=933632 RepID=A0ACB8EZT5_9SAUR